jgi:cytochrome d ubiquinol oxidase subunit I
MGVMRTAEAVTPMSGLVVPLVIFGLVYLFLGAMVVRILWNPITASETTDRSDTSAGGPYVP